LQKSKDVSERAIIFLIGTIQFINVLEFMMVMPLGPDFAKALDISSRHLGVVSGSYTAASAVAGLVASTFIERFDRRKALAFSMSGLILATFAAALSTNLTTLLAARILAGCFGGPSTSLSLAVVTDTIPVERRGRAMGAIMSTFAIASVLGVPAGLELAQIGGWRAPFIAIGTFGIAAVAMAITKLPPMGQHLESMGKPGDLVPLTRMLRHPPVLIALSSCALMMISGFLLVPNLAPFIQANLGFPREKLGVLYFVGGGTSFILMRVIGVITDKIGPIKVAWVASLLFIGTVYLGFLLSEPPLPIILIFSMFMVSMSLRGVAFNTLSSQVPAPSERARFMSIQSSVQHLASAVGATLSSSMLVEDSNKNLIGMASVATLAMIAGFLMPIFLTLLQKQLKNPPNLAKAL
jgi:predicted MFS family arabinose efflux permease